MATDEPWFPMELSGGPLHQWVVYVSRRTVRRMRAAQFRNVRLYDVQRRQLARGEYRRHGRGNVMRWHVSRRYA